VNNTMERAAPRKHQNDDQPRQISSRCNNDHIVASGLNQHSSLQKTNQTLNGGKMNQEIAIRHEDFSVIEQVVMQGDLSKLNPEQRVTYYRKVCETSGLNPFTNPFAYIYLNGKLTLYAKKDCTEQLRKINGVSIEGLDDKIVDDLYIVKARAKDKHGRLDESTGAVVIGHLKGEAKANAIMKAETKAKRRVTLSICGMGWTDESEIDSIPNAKPIDVDFRTGEIRNDYESRNTIQIEQKFEEKPKFNSQQVIELQKILEECEEDYVTTFYNFIQEKYKTRNLSELPMDFFEKAKKSATSNMEMSREIKKDVVEEESDFISIEDLENCEKFL